jgi:4-diphosphocytidyl-2C-methyl-D-erythritol kinase
MSQLAGRLLLRAIEMLDQIELTPESIRRDLTTTRLAPRVLYSATELIHRAADLLSDTAGLVHANERRWHIFRRRVEEIVALEQ